MKVSVIIPVKNRASLLPVTLDNILDQTLLPYEVIVVDDESTDDIQQVIHHYKDKVLFTKNEGKGPGAARNTGLSLATGSFIQFFDSDDLMSKNKLEVQSKLLAEENADFVYGPYVKAEEINGTWKQQGAVMQYYPLPGRKLVNMVLEGWCTLTQTTLFTKNLIKEAGYWRTDLMPHEDWEYWFRLAGAAHKFVHENESCVIYRQHGNQITDKAVLNRDRSLDGIKANEIINKERQGYYSLHSLCMFWGQNGYAKRAYNKMQTAKLPISFTELVSSYYYAMASKIAVRRAGTGWKKIHGANTSQAVFADYIKKF